MKKLLLIFLCITIIFNGLIVMAEETEVKISSGYRHIVFLNKYGRVMASGYNEQKQCDVYGWENVIDICAGKYFTAALFNDGTVKVTGEDESGNCFDASKLKNIIKITAGDNFLAALDADGYVYTLGNVSEIDTSEWAEIKDIAAGSQHIAGIKNDGTMVGTGLGVEGISNYKDIERIYAGAGLTVMINTDGILSYVGIGTYEESDVQDEGLIWIPSQWDGNTIKKIEIVRGSQGNGIVVALLNDNTVISDGKNDEMWTIDCSEVKNVIDISLSIPEDYPVLIAIKDDKSIEVFGILSSNPLESGPWKKDIEKINLTRKPIKKEHKENIFIGYKNIAFRLPSNGIKVIGEGSGAEEKNIGYFRYMVTSDNYIYEDLDGNIKSTVKVDNGLDISFTWNKPNDITLWDGVEEIATYQWDGNTELITGLRWDGQVYSTDRDDLVSKEVSNAADIVGGRYFTAILHDDKTVSAYASKNTYDLSNVKQWNNIEKIFAGYGQLIGLKADGTCVAAGGKKDENGYVAECDVAEWNDIVQAVCGYSFSIGLKSDGTCVVSAKETHSEVKEAVEKWSDIKEIYASHSHIIGYKNDGTFEVFVYEKSYKRPEFYKIKNVFYKNNNYIRYDDGTEGELYIEYALDSDKRGFSVFYDENDEIVDIFTVKMDGDGTLKEKAFKTENKNAKSYVFYVWDDFKPYYTHKNNF